jgi:hypothetical protein
MMEDRAVVNRRSGKTVTNFMWMLCEMIQRGVMTHEEAVEMRDKFFLELRGKANEQNPN